MEITHNAQRTTHNYKLIFSLILLCLLSISEIFAQSNYFYYYKKQKIYLTLDKSNATLSVLDNFTKRSLTNLNLKDFKIETENTTGLTNKFAKIGFVANPTDIEYYQKMNTLNNNPQIIKVQPNFLTQAGKKIGMSDYFYVKLKNSADLSLLQNFALQKNVQVISQNQFLPLWYTLKCKKNTIGNTLEVANFFFETNNFSAAVPDFLSVDYTSVDPLFPAQWNLANGVVNGVDINAVTAWNISQGANINIAILDQGIEKLHPDLIANISPLSYNTESIGVMPSQLLGGHGTACAGIISAVKDNNIGLVGVAPLSKIMDVSNSLSSTPNSRIGRANGIMWAWQNGADVINNSWGSSVFFEPIDEAIESALTNGRN